MKQATKDKITKAMIDTSIDFSDIDAMSEWINKNVKGIKVAVNMPYDAAVLDNLIVIED